MRRAYTLPRGFILEIDRWNRQGGRHGIERFNRMPHLPQRYNLSAVVGVLVEQQSRSLYLPGMHEEHLRGSVGQSIWCV